MDELGSFRALGVIPTMNYRQADAAFFAIVDSDGQDMFSSTLNTAFPETYGALFGFCAKTNSLKTAMFDLADSENPYAFRAVFRCFCEHYLRFTYLFARFLKEESDQVGTEYKSFCGAAEMRDYVSAIEVAQSLVGTSVVGDVDQLISTMYPLAAKLTRAELESASGKFRYRAILRFLSQETPEILSKGRPFLANIVPSYALLSSYVHGGPWTDREMFSEEWSASVAACQKDSELVFLMTASVFMFTAMAVSREFPRHAKAASSTKSLIDQYLASPDDDT